MRSVPSKDAAREACSLKTLRAEHALPPPPRTVHEERALPGCCTRSVPWQNADVRKKPSGSSPCSSTGSSPACNHAQSAPRSRPPPLGMPHPS
eukprot:353549-Chlamydomonas_euryale.AAC.2